jgi:hypothetical protein
MATPSKTQGTSLVSIQALSSGSFVSSSVQNVATVFGATLFVHVGRGNTSALTVGVKVRIQASAQSSGNAEWLDLAVLQSQIAGAASNTLAASGNNAGSTTLTATANWTTADGDLVFLLNGTVGNSEFVRAGAHSTTSLPVLDATTNGQNSSSAFDHADEFVVQLDLTSIGRIRVVFDGIGVGQTTYVEAYMVTCDSIG